MNLFLTDALYEYNFSYIGNSYESEI